MKNTRLILSSVLLFSCLIWGGCGISVPVTDLGTDSNNTKGTAMASSNMKDSKGETQGTIASSSGTLVDSAIPDSRQSIGTLLFLGRASVKINMTDGRVIYIDPFAGTKSDYEEKADLVLVTHQDYDHNDVRRVTLREGGEIIQCPKEIKAGDKAASHKIGITAVEAYNKNHPEGQGCGFVLDLGGVVLYHSGDTSTTDEMKSMKAMRIDYALLCTDGFYNMGPEEAMKVTDLLLPAHVIPMHTSRDKDYDQANVDAFVSDLKVAMKPGDVIQLYRIE